MGAALPASAGPRDVSIQVNPGLGMGREVAVLFADLRAFTRLSEGRLPYDVVFVLNRYFRATGEAIEAQGGRVDNFIGDAIMALFGIDQDPQAACRQARCAAARATAFALEQLNAELAHDLPERLHIGIGLHVGPAILGDMGYGRASSLTAVGDTVNVAARLEAVAKEFEVQLVASSRLAEAGGNRARRVRGGRIEIRGRRRPLRVRLVPDARALPLELGTAGAPALPAFAQLLSLGRRALHLDR